MSPALSAIKKSFNSLVDFIVYLIYSRFQTLDNIQNFHSFGLKPVDKIKIENKPKQNSVRQPLRLLSHFNSEENISTFVAICLSRVKFYLAENTFIILRKRTFIPAVTFKIVPTKKGRLTRLNRLICPENVGRIRLCRVVIIVHIFRFNKVSGTEKKFYVILVTSQCSLLFS